MNEIKSIHAKRLHRQKRDLELLIAYRTMLGMLLGGDTADEQVKERALRLALNFGRPHYNVSFEHAYRMLCEHKRQRWSKRRECDAMWREIAHKVSLLEARCGLSRAQALSFVLDHCRASRFFISERYAHYRLQLIFGACRRRAMRLAGQLQLPTAHEGRHCLHSINSVKTLNSLKRNGNNQ